MTKPVRYVAPRTLARFIRSNDYIRCIVGPVGSGKSSVCVVELLRRAAEQAPGPDKVRRTRFVVIRNTYSQLRDTTRKTFEQWCPPDAGTWNEQAFTFTLDQPCEDGTRIHSEIMFRALDRPEDTKKLLSLEVTGAYLNEAREIPKHVFDVLQTRVGRYPAISQGGASWFGIWMDTNPWPAGHWASKMFAQGHQGYRLFRQPGGRSDAAENVANLPPDYYERLCIGKDREWIRVYVDGEDASGDVGSIFGTWIGELHGRGGICSFDHPADGVFTSWDLGRGDSTAIWFWRINRHGVPDIIDHYEASGEGLGHYFNVVEAKGYQYRMHFLPHDAKQRTLATQQSVLDQAVARWGKGSVGLTPNLDKIDQIQAARWMLEQPMLIHERCHTPGRLGYSGLDALSAYKFKWDDVAMVFSTSPVHDWASNSADAFMYVAVAVKAAAHLLPKPAPEPQPFVPATVTMDHLSSLVATPNRRRI